jgi:hypothetical protein
LRLNPRPGIQSEAAKREARERLFDFHRRLLDEAAKAEKERRDKGR